MGLYMAPRFVVTSVATVLNNDAYDANDVIANGSFTHNMFSTHGGPFKVEQLWYKEDTDAAAANLTFVFMDANVEYGPLDSAPDITDAEGLNLVAHYAMASASLIDHGAFKLGVVQPNLIVQPSNASTPTLYYAIASAGTPTLATGCITVKLWLSAA